MTWLNYSVLSGFKGEEERTGGGWEGEDEIFGWVSLHKSRKTVTRTGIEDLRVHSKFFGVFSFRGYVMQREIHLTQIEGDGWKWVRVSGTAP